MFAQLYLEFTGIRCHCYRAPMLSTSVYQERSNRTFRFSPHCWGVCWFVVCGTRSCISLGFCSGIFSRECNSITQVHISKCPWHTLGQHKRQASPLKMFSACKWSQWYTWLMLFIVSADFSEYFRKSSLTQNTKKWNSVDPRRILAHIMKIKVRPALSFGTHPIIFSYALQTSATIPLPPWYLCPLNINGQLTPFLEPL